MQTYRVNPGAGIDGLRLETTDIPSPGPYEVLVRVKAVSLNSRELMIILHNRYPLPVKQNGIPVSDGAGEVIAVGAGVTRVRVGDRVAAALFPDWIDGQFNWERARQIGGSIDGMLTEYALIPESAAVHLPEGLSFEQAATLPCAAVTAWNAFSGGLPLLPGQTVLTLGSGSVSLFALQLAQLFGARVIATTSSDNRAIRLKALGAAAVINYRATPDWNVPVRDLTGGRGVDLVVEVLLGDIQTASAQSAYSYPWCSVRSRGAMSCYYTSWEQCRTTLSGIGGNCIRSPYYRPSPPEYRK